MSELSTSELRRLDLTLLLVFLGLVRHRKALDVAAELGLTQSAISQSLKRLRDGARWGPRVTSMPPRRQALSVSPRLMPNRPY
jgi:Bacterial regulatory helix-turn-helix protein, lysR family